MPPKRTDDDIYVDANGCLAEDVDLDGIAITIHYDDLPDSDVSMVGGIPCTTALRTVIDIASDVGAADSRRSCWTASSGSCSPSRRPWREPLSLTW